MPDLNELDKLLEASSLPAPPEVIDGEFEEEASDPDQMLTDLLKGLTLLHKARTLLLFISDPLLCVSITKRERVSMERLTEKIRQHLCEVEATYDELGDLL